ncbi:hypothetical protein GEMRC1_008409 [Eukaryota sp. GEM-RC1]
MTLCFIPIIHCNSFKDTSFDPSDCTGDWVDLHCWSNGVPTYGDRVYLDSCPVSTIDLPTPMSLSFLQIGSEDCAFHLQLSSVDLHVQDLHFVSGSIAGAGTLSCTGDSVFSSTTVKVIQIPLHNSGSLTFSHSSSSSLLLQLHGQGSITNTGSISIVSSTIISLSDYHLSPSPETSLFFNYGLLLVDDNADLVISIPFQMMVQF